MQQSEYALTGALEAVLFAAGESMTVDALAKLMQLESSEIEVQLTNLQQILDERQSGLTLRQAAGGYQLVTRPEVFPIVERLSQVVERKLSAPTMETLSIIAFKQPTTKAEIEHIRGVRVERALQKLLDLELITEMGRKKVIGRPILYGTTDNFLRCFGINSLADLPQLPSTDEAVAALEPEQLALFQEVQKMHLDNEAATNNEATTTEN